MSSIYHHSKNIFAFLVYSYGLWYGFTSIVCNLSPVLLIPALILLLALYAFKIPKPPSAQVEQIVGKDPAEETSCGTVVMRMIAHRGAGLDAPENSLIAFRRCMEKNCMFIEFDITLTKDEVPVVFHDETLERVANDKRLPTECTWPELQNIDISVNHPFSDRFTGTRIPTLDDTIKQLLSSRQNMFIDIKDNDMRMVKVILELFKKYPELHHRAVVSTFFPHLIYLIRWKNPKIVCSLAHRPYYFSHVSYAIDTGTGPRRAKSWHKHMLYCLASTVHTWALPRFTYFLLGLSFVLFQKDLISARDVADWRKKEVRVGVWASNHPVEKQYFSRILKITYFTDTLNGESSTHLNSK